MTILIRKNEEGPLVDIAYPDMHNEGLLLSTNAEGGIEVNFIDEETGREVIVYLSDKVVAGIAAYHAVRHDEEKAAEACLIIEANIALPPAGPLPSRELGKNESPYPF